MHPYIQPAAFRRLCVETKRPAEKKEEKNQPPSGGCVLKHQRAKLNGTAKHPAAFRRLCVETKCAKHCKPVTCTSRLQAAVC